MSTVSEARIYDSVFPPQDALKDFVDTFIAEYPATELPQHAPQYVHEMNKRNTAFAEAAFAAGHLAVKD